MQKNGGPGRVPPQVFDLPGFLGHAENSGNPILQCCGTSTRHKAQEGQPKDILTFDNLETLFNTKTTRKVCFDHKPTKKQHN